MANVTVLDHPPLRHKVTLSRDRTTPSPLFRQTIREMGLLMAYEATRDLPLTPIDIETPLEPMRTEHSAGAKVCIVSVLRAGNGLLDGVLDLFPTAAVGHIGLYRDAVTLRPVEYYLKLPAGIADRLVMLVDPMLATGHTAAAAAARVKQAAAALVRFACLLAAPEGIALFAREHPDVPVFTAAIDRELDGHGYIRPGLGDAGDRLYGTD